MKIKLVLAGKPHIDIPKSNDIIHLGFIPEQDKFDALTAARLLVVPSFYESLSMVMLEAFYTKTPVLANRRCMVLKDQCERSNGGLYYSCYAEFSECLNFLLCNHKVSMKLGEQGEDFVKRNYNWDRIEDKYLSLVSAVKASMGKNNN